MLTLAGRTALVTGASRGIGRHTAILMTRLGARVALGYGRDEAAAREALAATGGDGVVLGADLAKEGEAEKLVARADEALSGLDVLVANHGIWKRAPIESMTAAQWDEMLVTNLSSVRALCSEAARRMLKRGRGSIVLVASTAGQRGEPFHSHYAASKGAILALTRSLAAELGPARSPRQLRRSRLGGHRHEPRSPRGRRSATPSCAPSRWGGRARPTRSPARSRSWPPTSRATCTGRSCR